ncbi:uncharacterized protein LOC135929938 [Gordionus sp. m RMFG-2023]|uniref:uncharacterized protein LOC135929938 n=1 Tax=Gordionus sp. m RMFG-2023 TaxID=3053472 RepID=UPI0031FCEF9E
MAESGTTENKMYLLVLDAFSIWVENEEVRGLTTQVVIKMLKKLWARFGVANIIFSDGSQTFISGQFKLFCEETGARHFSASIPFKLKRPGRKNGSTCEELVKKIKQFLTVNEVLSMLFDNIPVYKTDVVIIPPNASNEEDFGENDLTDTPDLDRDRNLISSRH